MEQATFGRVFQSTAIGDGELGMASWAMTSFFSPRGFGLGHRDCTRRLLYGMIVYTAGGTRRRVDKHEAWRSRRRRKVGPRSGGERSRCEASEGRGEKGRAGVEQPGARKGVLAAGRRLRAAGRWLLAVAVGCWLLAGWLLASCSRAAGRPLAASSRGLLRASKPKAAAGPRATRRKKREITPQPYASPYPHPVQQSRSLLQ